MAIKQISSVLCENKIFIAINCHLDLIKHLLFLNAADSSPSGCRPDRRVTNNVAFIFENRFTFQWHTVALNSMCYNDS